MSAERTKAEQVRALREARYARWARGRKELADQLTELLEPHLKQRRDVIEELQAEIRHLKRELAKRGKRK